MWYERNPSRAVLERGLKAYLEHDGNASAAARSVGAPGKVFLRLCKKYGWDRILQESQLKTMDNLTRTFADSHSRVIREIIDPFLDAQARELADELVNRDGKLPLDTQEVERMVKLRELLTGGATNRDSDDPQRLAKAINGMSDDKKRELAEIVRRLALDAG